MHGASAKSEVFLTSASSRPPAAPVDLQSKRSPPRRQKPRHVIYKSTALQRAAPSLVAAASANAISATKAIQRAADEAEKVRDDFKLSKCGPEIDLVDGDDEATNAKKYERRLLMNRHSAAASRVRREAYTKALEAQIVQLEGNMNSVVKAYEAEKEKNRLLMANAPTSEEEDQDESEGNRGESDSNSLPSDMQDHDQADAFADARVGAEMFMGMSATGALMQQPRLESQTEDNSEAFGVSDMPPLVPLEAPPPHHQQFVRDLNAVKDEVFDIANGTVPAELLSVPDDKLLDCFLRVDAMPSQVEFDSLELF
ncbi:unnamed protein product [Chondrus crispus]|uniref:BZIP domain-containing protein n=1 Tax=Chondrus crispus TaxID=2769 RepID=R7QEH7_CHOCR|nr:unnamed protein product [Chondrus crispus]CDF36173.1 unnamed protein product [Chondrus crispus]|eukprot:XP_005715992.1 unnamed protein product [Chondrus crispus]